MLMNILLGCGLVFATTLVHATVMVMSLRALRIMHAGDWARTGHYHRATVIATLVLALFIASILEAGLWAAAYLVVGAISGIEEAVYFSTVTYTTLGYGDVVMTDHWRLLSAFEAANGIIMFGWSTAVLVAALQRIYIHGQDGSPSKS